LNAQVPFRIEDVSLKNRDGGPAPPLRADWLLAQCRGDRGADHGDVLPEEADGTAPALNHGLLTWRMGRFGQSGRTSPEAPWRS